MKIVRIPLEMPYGKTRREWVKMALSQEGARLYVNSYGCPQLKADPDLKKLIKIGILKSHKDRERSFNSSMTYHRTYLTRS